jgi:hypothetical protein
MVLLNQDAKMEILLYSGKARCNDASSVPSRALSHCVEVVEVVGTLCAAPQDLPATLGQRRLTHEQPRRSL